MVNNVISLKPKLNEKLKQQEIVDLCRAKDRHTKISTLINLSHNRSPLVRRAVASNLNTPEFTIQILTEDPVEKVRYTAVSNIHIFPETLECVINNTTESLSVRSRAQITYKKIIGIREEDELKKAAGASRKYLRIVK